MPKAAMIVYADTGNAEQAGRVGNALETAKEFKEHGDEIRVIFDGTGTKWIPELEDSSHHLNPLYQTVKHDVQVCDYCADAFHVIDSVRKYDVELVAEYEGHPSIRSLVVDGYEIITI
jgi:hypothetical protein